MATLHDVVAVILEEGGPMTTMKLQKLVYFCQVWSLVWEARPLFPQEIYAWVNGPAIRDLSDGAQFELEVDEWPLGNAVRLTRSERETVSAVVRTYGRLTSRELGDLVRRDAPWRKARQTLVDDDRSDQVISHESMLKYYGTPRRDARWA